MSAQQAALQDLAAQQVLTLKGLQGSLSAIENRLTNSGAGRSSALADRPRIGIFVDVPNIMYAAEREHVTLDYGRVLDFIIGNRELVRASAYAPISDDPDEELGLEFLGEIPLDRETREGADKGVPITESEPESPQAQAFLQVAKQVAARCSTLQFATAGVE